MSKRAVVVGGATAVAGLVLGASIVFGPPPLEHDPSTLPDQIGAPGVGQPGTNGTTGVNVRGFVYNSFKGDSKDQFQSIQIRAQYANLETTGVTKLNKPVAQIRMGTRRAITISADKADLAMDDNKPRAGRFTGNVVVTLFQAPEDTPLTLDHDDPSHAQFIQQRIYLDEPCDFSIEDDTIHTPGPVHLTSTQVDFFGIGLRLAYNTQRERIEQLVFDQGRYLLFNPEADAPGFTADNKTQDPQDKPATPAEPDATRIPPAMQYYQARFIDNVKVRDGLENELAGQTLEILFSLGTEAITPKPLTPTTGLPALLSLPGGQLAQAQIPGDPAAPTADPAAAPLPIVTIPQRNRDRSLFSHKPERDLVITWDKALEVKPLAHKPEQLADEDDVQIKLIGDNAYAQTTQDGNTQRIETVQLEYLLSKQRTTALSNQDKPVRIVSTELGGEITAQKIIVDPLNQTATLFGPGQLTHTNKKEGKALTCTWDNRLDLALYTAQPDEQAAANTNTNTGGNPAGRSQTKILGVKTATFDGNVTARHTDFDLDAKRLTLAFAKPDKQGKVKNTLTSIDAAGQVVAHAAGDNPDEIFDITAQRLSIDLTIDEKDPDRELYASAIRAQDDVRIARPGSLFTCQAVAVELIPPSATPDKPKDKPGDKDTQADKDQSIRSAQVQTIVATGDVYGKLDQDDRHIELVADQLIGDVQRNRLTLSSNNRDKPAEFLDLTDDRKITGQLIVMDDEADALTITGPGSLAAKIDDPDQPKATIEDAFISIAWEKSMSFDNVTGQAEFIDAVRTESRRFADASEMTADHLAMQFTPDAAEEQQQDEQPADPEQPEQPEAKDDKPRQVPVQSAVATGNVKFLASAWNPANPKQIDNRVRLEGNKLVFTNTPAATPGGTPTETLVVPGEGRMVLEDYRAPQKPEKNGEKKQDDKALMTGRGATLFVWTRSLTLDAQTNDATLLGEVGMVHLPKDEQGNKGDSVELNCEKLVADMTNTGGLSVWLSDNAPDAQITAITADGNVELIHQARRSMRGDHMKFDAKTNTAQLWSDPNRSVWLKDLVRDSSTETNKVTWDLTKDRIEIDQLKGGSEPLN